MVVAGFGRGVGGGFLDDDGAFAGEVALGANAFLAGGFGAGGGAVVEVASEVVGARPLLAVLAEVDADFFLARQGSDPPGAAWGQVD